MTQINVPDDLDTMSLDELSQLQQAVSVVLTKRQREAALPTLLADMASQAREAGISEDQIAQAVQVQPAPPKDELLPMEPGTPGGAPTSSDTPGTDATAPPE